MTAWRGPGGQTGGATPVPIPNTAVKPSRADGTALVTVRESRSPPGLFHHDTRVAHAARAFVSRAPHALSACDLNETQQTGYPLTIHDLARSEGE